MLVTVEKKQLWQQAAANKNLHICNHPLVQVKLTLLRDAESTSEIFRTMMRQITPLLLYDALASLELCPRLVKTPITSCEGHELLETICFVPILRAGMSMEAGALEFVPNAQVRHLGLERDEHSHEPKLYYGRLEREPQAGVYYVLDPMLATGGSACDAIKEVKKCGKPVRFVGLIAAPEGVLRVAQEHPDVPMFVAALDSHLNEKAYIVPGLGDAGDRYYNT